MFGCVAAAGGALLHATSAIKQCAVVRMLSARVLFCRIFWSVMFETLCISCANAVKPAAAPSNIRHHNLMRARSKPPQSDPFIATKLPAIDNDAGALPLREASTRSIRAATKLSGGLRACS
jgi:hypothetical protein